MSDNATGLPHPPATVPPQTQEHSYRMNTPKLPRNALALFSALALLSGTARAQSVPQPQQPNPDGEDETLVLSPFTVNATDESDTYLVKETLAGARVRTDIRDIATALTVVNSKFLRDTGARNNQDLLVYMSNTEVGGLYGNYAGVGGTFIDGASEASNFARPNANTRVRGLDSADNTRDFFATYIPWDAYNVDRVDLQRGPNSILFGFGSPAGIINNSVNTAGYKTQGRYENRFGSFGSFRNTFDYNWAILPNELAVRISLLDDRTEYRQEPAFNHDRRLFAALRYDPKLFRRDNARTTFRANFEYGKITANRPRVLPPRDRITPFFDPEGINRQTWDPYFAWEEGVVAYSNSALAGSPLRNMWVIQGMGINGVNTPMFVYDNVLASMPAFIRQSSPNTAFGLKSDGTLDRSIDGFPYGSQIGIGTYNQYALNYQRVMPDGNERFPAADKGFYKTRSITDTSIFDFYEKLIDGPNKMEWQNWKATNLALQQSFLNNRLAFEAVYDYQDYDDGQQRNLDNPYISVDINQNLMVYPWAYNTPPVAFVRNPNAGRAFVGDSVKNGGNSSFDSERRNIRLTGYGEVRATDFLNKSLLSDVLGTHRFTALWAREKHDMSQKSWVRYAAGSDWSEAIGNGPTGTAQGGLQNGDQVVDWLVYLSPDLRNLTSASGLNLDRIHATQSPNGRYTIDYYDSHPKAGFTNWGDAWYNPARGEASFESENPANYVGWRQGQFNIYNADAGDRNRLLTEISNVHQRTTSKGAVWQAYLWEDTIVATLGWRTDKQDSWAEAAQYSTAQQGLGKFESPGGRTVSEDDSVSWGVVVHTPKAIRRNLPWGTNVSLTYSKGKNSRVETRFGFDGSKLPNAKGETDDYGIVVSTLNDRLMAKATWYKTEVKNANLSTVTTEASTLGNNTYYLRNLEAWGTASALLNLAGRAGQAVGWEWYWNWAMIAGVPGTGAEAWNAAYWDPSPAGTAESRARFNAHPETVKQTAAINSWLEQMLPQSWFNAYGFPVDVTKAQAGDFAGAISGWTPTAGVGGVQPAGGGRINGVWPTGTVDNESKGVEFELVGEPIKGWNIFLNVTKTKASQTALGAELSDFIESSYEKYQSPAGDLRLWWGGDRTVREYYTENIWAAYQFQLRSSGRLVPEMTPWRYNLTTTYAFQKGALQGAYVGGSYRWEDKTIIGYGLNAARDNLDVDRPFWSDTRDYFGLWAGYGRDLSRKVRWQIQLNVNNIGLKPHLIPISVQPDGSPGQFRINEGMTWNLTNTFTF